MEDNKVRVRIYGQDYVITGGESKEHMMRVADYVDSKMQEIGKSLKSGQVSLLAILSAVNIADEYFNSSGGAAELKKANIQLEKDVEHYIQMWEEAKKSFLQYKEDAQTVSRKKESLKNTLAEKEQEIAELKAMLEEAEMKARKDVEGETEKLQDKLKETESNFFDIQMENVQLKSELERLRKVMV